MVFAVQAFGFAVADIVNDFHGGAGVFQPKPVAIEGMLITHGMQVVEAFAEFEFFAFNFQGTVGAAAFGLNGFGEDVVIDAEEPAHAGVFQFQEPCGPVVGVDMDDILFHWTKDPHEHVVEVDADVGGNSSGFFHVAFPTGVVPVPPGSQVGEVDVPDLVFWALLDFFPEGDHRRVEAELQDAVDLLPGFLFDLLEGVDVPGVEHEGFFANHVGAVPQPEAHVGVVEVVRRADADVVDGFALAFQLFEVAVEALEFDKEVGVGEMAVDDPDGIKFIHGGYQHVSRVLDRPHVARRYKPGGANQRKIFHGLFSFLDLAVLE